MDGQNHQVEDIMGRREVAALLGCTERHVSELVRDEGLPMRQVGKRLLTTREAVLRWLGDGEGRAVRR